MSTEEKAKASIAENGSVETLTFEPNDRSQKGDFDKEVNKILEKTEKELITSNLIETGNERAWQFAREIVEGFQPAPWFIWRLSNFVFGSNGRPNKVQEGLVLGLRRLLFAAASDPVLGAGKKVNNMREALKVVRSDVVAAISVIHGISRKLHSKDFERIWRPILDDAVIRAHIGFFVGQNNLDFGPGRGMLAGFAGRCGLAILIASGSEHQAHEAQTLLAAGKTLKEVGVQLYQVDPIQVSALTLSAAGCGKDAAFGTVGYSSYQDGNDLSIIPYEQKRWLAAYMITDAARVNKLGNTPR